ncbi:MAG: CDP-alcohol phosphatidyltransferase family protein [Deltaproteobacteria bacterium]|nr:CDP-alcohol phosphatidyltransferase family protein [Deltaproteobacteria bacterium]
MYFGFVLALKQKRVREYFIKHFFLQPNAICIWRVIIGLSGTMLYAVAGEHAFGILLFTISAVLDGVDGLVARKCGLSSSLGEELDPLCDKLTYLPPFIFFAYMGLLNTAAVILMVAIETTGQFLVRYIIKRFTKFSVAANNFGKIKAVLCFALIIYCALLDGGIGILDISNQILYLCIILSISSIVFKVIPNRFYADILSTLNLICGMVGIFFVFEGRYVYVAIAILAGQMFDLFDGRMAEKHGGTKFGPWFDDIADFISFGICPGLLIILIGGFSALSLIFGALYSLSIGYRLWRFLIHDKYNTDLPPGFFNGLPSPAGAMVIMGICLFLENQWIIWAITLLTASLLVSHISFVHFGKVVLSRIPRTLVIILGFIIAFIIAYLIKTGNPVMLGALLLAGFILYVITSIKITFTESG